MSSTVEPAVLWPETAARIRGRLLELGVSTYELAKRSGLSERHLGDLVAGRVARPRKTTLRAIAGALELSVDDLITGTHAEPLAIELSVIDTDALRLFAIVRRSSPEAEASRMVANALASERSRNAGFDAMLTALTEARFLDSS